jgi:mRNA deadenylase 3'-5' endonuclease subunit Ccr4
MISNKSNRHFESVESSSFDKYESLNTTGLNLLTRKNETNALKESLVQPEVLVQEQSYKEMSIMKKKTELKELKKQEMKRILKVFSTVPPSSRKILLPKIIPALFGENLYEIEITKKTKQ